MSSAVQFAPATTRKRKQLAVEIAMPNVSVEDFVRYNCHIREYEWIPDWDIDIIYTESGVTEQDSVISFDLPGQGGRDIWTYPVHEEGGRHAIAYRINGIRVSLYECWIEDDGQGGSKHRWELTMTALNEAGDRWVESQNLDGFEEEMQLVSADIERIANGGEAYAWAPNHIEGDRFAPVKQQQRRHFQASYPMAVPADELWELACPVREYEWEKTWDIELLYSESGVGEKAAIIRHDRPGQGGEDVWIFPVYDKPSRRVVGVRRNAVRLAVYRFHYDVNDQELCTAMHSEVTLTALNDEGERWLETQNQEDFANEMLAVKEQLEHRINSGEVFAHAPNQL